MGVEVGLYDPGKLPASLVLEVCDSVADSEVPVESEVDVMTGWTIPSIAKMAVQRQRTQD